MSKYRKKPVVIEAVQWTGANLDAIKEHAGEDAQMVDGQLFIRTSEGNLHASRFDWIIKGVKGEHYPCKPDIFDNTYDPATDPEPAA